LTWKREARAGDGAADGEPAGEAAVTGDDEDDGEDEDGDEDDDGGADLAQPDSATKRIAMIIASRRGTG
jgi:hypothetical protein